MAQEKLEVIKEADLTNNCPECFNQDLKLTFYQKHLYGKLFHRVTGEVTHKVKCNKCGSDIYPVKWTDDIERIFEYYQKMVKPEKASIGFTKLFYILILLLIVLVGAGVYLFLVGVIQF
ncbi:hypothetical protein [Maribacter halichondriae]|uniref:hypothetical protein n=1 Tax=Maribacter halichondriae TaxID=2980554 RepID=UPI002358A70E|nr:hypothetical protein [Maribacter sp. Hal144]